MITTIDGWPGAGKTTLAAHLADTFADRGSTFVVHMDDLYRGWHQPFTPELSQTLLAIATAHESKREITLTKWDWEQNRPGELLTIPPVDHLIIEGVGAGQRAIRGYAQTKIWVEIEPVVGLRRVIDRDSSVAGDLESYELLLRGFAEAAALHCEEEGTVYASDFEVNGQATL